MYYPPKLFWNQVSAWGFVDTGETDRRANINSSRVEIWVRPQFVDVQSSPRVQVCRWSVQAENVDTGDMIYLSTERELSKPRLFRSLDAVHSLLLDAGRRRFYVDGHL